MPIMRRARTYARTHLLPRDHARTPAKMGERRRRRRRAEIFSPAHNLIKQRNGEMMDLWVREPQSINRTAENLRHTTVGARYMGSEWAGSRTGVAFLPLFRPSFEEKSRERGAPHDDPTRFPETFFLSLFGLISSIFVKFGCYRGRQ